MYNFTDTSSNSEIMKRRYSIENVLLPNPPQNSFGTRIGAVGCGVIGSACNQPSMPTIHSSALLASPYSAPPNSTIFNHHPMPHFFPPQLPIQQQAQQQFQNSMRNATWSNTMLADSSTSSLASFSPPSSFSSSSSTSSSTSPPDVSSQRHQLGNQYPTNYPHYHHNQQQQQQQKQQQQFLRPVIESRSQSPNTSLVVNFLQDSNQQATSAAANSGDNTMSNRHSFGNDRFSTSSFK